MEEYGIVPGLGNLHERFAYNSSFFALSALYSLKFVLGYSMHAMSGFVALVLSIACLPIMKSWKRKSFSLADFARVGAIYYLTTITNEVVSPASDYAAMCIVFYVVIKWLDALEKDVKEIKADVKCITQKPAKKWEMVTTEALKIFIAAVLGFLIAKFGL